MKSHNLNDFSSWSLSWIQSLLKYEVCKLPKTFLLVLVCSPNRLLYIHTRYDIHYPILLQYYNVSAVKHAETLGPLFLQMDSSIGLSGNETTSLDAETSSSSVSSCTTVSTQSSGKTRKPPKILQISPPTLLVTTSDFSPMSLCSPSLPTASLTPAMIQVNVCIHSHLGLKSFF